MNLNNDVVYRSLRIGPLHQLHAGRSRSLIRHHNRLHRSPPCVEFLPVRQPLHPLSLDGLSDRNGSIKILASPASMRNAEWPCHVCFIGIASSVSSVLLNGGGERFVVGVDDDDSEQLRRLGLARVAADWMVRVRRFGPALAGLINAGLAVVHL